MSRAIYQPFPMLPGRRGQIWKYAPEYRRPRHFHGEPELNLVLAGTATFASGRNVIAATAGALLCWSPGVDHELLAASADLELFVFAVTPELCERALPTSGTPPMAGPLLVDLPRGEWPALRALVSAPAHGPEVSAADEHVANLWISAHRARMDVPKARGLGARVLRSLLQAPGLDRRERARLIGAHPTEVSRHFHRELGITLTTYRARLRLLRFIDNVDSGQNLLRAALAAGFGSYSQCHRAFTSAFGCSPRTFFSSAWRRDMADQFVPFGL